MGGRKVLVPKSVICPLTMEVFNEPYTLVGGGFSYERKVIEAWLKVHSRSPVSGEFVFGNLVPNTTLQMVINNKQQRSRAVWPLAPTTPIFPNTV